MLAWRTFTRGHYDCIRCRPVLDQSNYANSSRGRPAHSCGVVFALTLQHCDLFPARVELVDFSIDRAFFNVTDVSMRGVASAENTKSAKSARKNMSLRLACFTHYSSADNIFCVLHHHQHLLDLHHMAQVSGGSSDREWHERVGSGHCEPGLECCQLVCGQPSGHSPVGVGEHIFWVHDLHVSHSSLTPLVSVVRRKFAVV